MILILKIKIIVNLNNSANQVHMNFQYGGTDRFAHKDKSIIYAIFKEGFLTVESEIMKDLTTTLSYCFLKINIITPSPG